MLQTFVVRNNREYTRLNKRLLREHPVTFPLTADYDDLPKCTHCGTWFFPSETLGTKERGWCCKNGTMLARITPPAPLPVRFKQMLLSNEGRIRELSRKYNLRFSFSSLGVAYGEFEKQQYPNALRCSGWLYTRILHAEAYGPLRYYVHDPLYDHVNGALDAPTVLHLGQLITSTNPFALALREFGANPSYHDCVLQVEWNQHAAQTSEMASIVHKPTWETPTKRMLVVYRSSAQFHAMFPDATGNNHNGYFVPMDHPLAEALQYPLFYWGGHKDVGWCPEMYKNKSTRVTLNQYVRHRAMVPERTSTGAIDRSFLVTVDAQANPPRRLPLNRFQLAGRLNCEWLINMFTRVEDSRLMWQRQHQSLLTGRALPVDDVHDEDAQFPDRVSLHRSLTGSPKQMKQKTADGLQIVHKIGKPLFFITFTCNPKWPEILSALPPGQTASDQPILTCRVFKMKLQALLSRLKSGLIFQLHDANGNVVDNVQHFQLKNGRSSGFIISVIEFQKRGLPHAHIAFRPACVEHQIKLTEGEHCEWVDHYICARLPDEASTSENDSNRPWFRKVYNLTDDQVQSAQDACSASHT